MSEIVREKLEQCQVCGQHNPKPGVKTDKGRFPLPSGPGKHIVMDYTDMGPEQRIRVYRYLLVIVDSISGWVEAIPTKREDAASCVKALMEIQIPRHGFPVVIRTDNITHFKNADLQKVEESFGIKHKFCSVYHPQRQELVERANGLLKMKLPKTMAVTGLTWVDAFPIVLHDLRNTPKAEGLTPLQLHTVRMWESPAGGFTPEDRDLTPPSYTPAYWSALTNALVSVRDYRLQDEKDSQGSSSGSTPDIPGWVHINKHKRTWTEPRWIRPCKVTESTGHAVKVQGGEVWYHLNQCARAVEPDREIIVPVDDWSTEEDDAEPQQKDSQCTISVNHTDPNFSNYTHIVANSLVGGAKQTK
uniref:Integrase catalytic domain-containing protein n=1 Tax=Cynoglossus semilaevis TaxID=244447 RepID=A0A3P8WRF1_CYNSE